MKCADCKHYKAVSKIGIVPGWCEWHGAIISKDLLELDSAEKDCLGFERKAEVSR